MSLALLLADCASGEKAGKTADGGAKDAARDAAKAASAMEEKYKGAEKLRFICGDQEYAFYAESGKIALATMEREDFDAMAELFAMSHAWEQHPAGYHQASGWSGGSDHSGFVYAATLFTYEATPVVLGRPVDYEWQGIRRGRGALRRAPLL